MRGMFGFILDITERKEWETQIKKLSKAVKQSPVSVIIADRYRRIEYVNPKFTETTGYTPEEVIGLYLAEAGPNGTVGGKYSEIFSRLIEGHGLAGGTAKPEKKR